MAVSYKAITCEKNSGHGGWILWRPMTHSHSFFHKKQSVPEPDNTAGTSSLGHFNCFSREGVKQVLELRGEGVEKIRYVLE